MTNRRKTVSATLSVLLLCVVLLSACISGPNGNALYTLRPSIQEPLGHEFAALSDMILVMPVHLAPQLQGRHLVRRQSAVESKAAPHHFWSGPLDQQIAGNLISNLKALLATDNIAAFPGPRFGTIRYQVEVEINEFSGDERSFTTGAVYTLSDAAAQTILCRKSFHRTRAIDPPDYSGYVESASQALDDLSKEVAMSLLAARQSQPGSAHEK